MGYKAGGFPPYGMRRMLLDVHGKPKQLLADGERKSLAAERVILVPGPKKEIAVVQRIFREYADESRSLTKIAERLNEEACKPSIQILAEGRAASLSDVLRATSVRQAANG